MLPDDSFIVKLLCIYRFYPDSIELLLTLRHDALKTKQYTISSSIP